METVKINKKIKEDFSQFCKETNLNKSKIVEELYKCILLRVKSGALVNTSGYVTINIFQPNLKGRIKAPEN